MPRKLTYEEVVSRFRDNGYELLETSYKGNREKMKFLCPEHGIKYNNIFSLSTGYGCDECGKNGNQESRRPKSMFASKKIGRLTLVTRQIINGKAHWECLCECGSTTLTREDSLMKNIPTESCGCLWLERISKNYGEASLHVIYVYYLTNARRKKTNFELTKEEFRTLTKTNCHYCGVEPSRKFHARATRGEYVYNGVDRVDSKQGYISKNVVACCTTCNRAKNDLTKEEFSVWINQLIKYQSGVSIDANGSTVAR